MEWMAEKAMLTVINNDMVSKMVYTSIVMVPNIGPMIRAGGMVWNMLNDDNKKEMEEFIKNSYVLKGYQNKFLIITKIVKNAPAMEVEIPSQMKPILEIFGIDNVNAKELPNMLNANVGKLKEWMVSHENVVSEISKSIIDMIKAKMPKGGKTKKKRSRSLKKISKNRKYCLFNSKLTTL